MRKMISAVEESYKEGPYDSSKDTYAHINNITNVLNDLLDEIDDRKCTHDLSKLREPEKSTYDKYIPLLRTAKYGTKEYQEIRDKMYEEGLRHHYESNRHHPEHFENGIKDMNLVDIIEMFSDWVAASMRSDTGFIEGIEINKKKFGMSDDLCQLFINTFTMYFSELKDESYTK